MGNKIDTTVEKYEKYCKKVLEQLVCTKKEQEVYVLTCIIRYKVSAGKITKKEADEILKTLKECY